MKAPMQNDKMVQEQETKQEREELAVAELEKVSGGTWPRDCDAYDPMNPSLPALE
jgi:hypothetical protein